MPNWAISRPIASKRRTPRACGLAERLRLIACGVNGRGGLRGGSFVGLAARPVNYLEYHIIICALPLPFRAHLGRLTTTPEAPRSSNIFLQPAFFSAAVCNAGFWSSVETRAYSALRDRDPFRYTASRPKRKVHRGLCTRPAWHSRARSYRQGRCKI